MVNRNEEVYDIRFLTDVEGDAEEEFAELDSTLEDTEASIDGVTRSTRDTFLPFLSAAAFSTAFAGGLFSLASASSALGNAFDVLRNVGVGLFDDLFGDELGIVSEDLAHIGNQLDELFFDRSGGVTTPTEAGRGIRSAITQAAGPFGPLLDLPSVTGSAREGVTLLVEVNQNGPILDPGAVRRQTYEAVQEALRDINVLSRTRGGP